MLDFLVIGGGIAGMSAAARLSGLGRVTVLEAEAGLGYHASGRSAAMFEQSYGLPSTIALNRASRDYLSAANGGVLTPRGMLVIGTADTGAAFARDMREMDMQTISPAEAAALVPCLKPDVVVEVAYTSEALDIDTDRLMQNFARQARENGASVLTKKSVCSIERISGGWQVSCSGGDEFSAKILINAAGAWVDQIAQMAGITPLGFVPLRRSMARIAAPGGVHIQSWPMMFGAGEAWYAKPDAGALLVSPADEVLVEPHDAWAEDLALAEGIDRYQQVVRHEEIRLISSWAGIRTFSPDRSLVIGPDAHAPSFFWMAGQGGYGFQTSPAASQLLCDLVGGSKSELDAATVRALSPARFG